MKKTKIYEGKILGLSVYDGKIKGRKVRREVIEHRGAAAMLAFDEDNRIILVITTNAAPIMHQKSVTNSPHIA